MDVIILYSDEFKRKIKPLYKKYPSLRTDFSNFLNELESTPDIGVNLGGGMRKARLAIASKGKGKSGGVRIITYNVVKEQEQYVITLLTIYDKGEMSNVSDTYLQAIVKTLK